MNESFSGLDQYGDGHKINGRIVRYAPRTP